MSMKRWERRRLEDPEKTRDPPLCDYERILAMFLHWKDMGGQSFEL